MFLVSTWKTVFRSNVISLCYLLCRCVDVLHSTHVEITGQLVVIVFSFHHVNSRDGTLVVRSCVSAFSA